MDETVVNTVMAIISFFFGTYIGNKHTNLIVWLLIIIFPVLIALIFPFSLYPVVAVISFLLFSFGVAIGKIFKNTSYKKEIYKSLLSVLTSNEKLRELFYSENLSIKQKGIFWLIVKGYILQYISIMEQLDNADLNLDNAERKMSKGLKLLQKINNISNDFCIENMDWDNSELREVTKEVSTYIDIDYNLTGNIIKKGEALAVGSLNPNNVKNLSQLKIQLLDELVMFIKSNR